MLRCCVGNTALAALFMGTTLCMCDGSCGTTVPVLNARHIEHVNTLGDRITIV